MTCETLRNERQSTAFGLLREEARAAHRRGAGLRVCEMCQTALPQIEQLIRDSNIRISLHEVTWAFVLQFYWLQDAHYLQLASDLLEKFPCSSETDEHARRLLQSYCDLIRHPIRPRKNLEVRLASIDGRYFGEESSVEMVEAITHILELAWFSAVDSDLWNVTAKRWQSEGSSWVAQMIPRIVERLRIQARLADPQHNHGVVDDVEAAALRTTSPMAELWLLYLHSLHEAVHAGIERLSPSLRSDASEWRCLGDLWHTCNPFGPKPGGDSQAYWLSRRPALISESPVLTFESRRHQRIDSLLRELFRSRETSGASQRMEAFQLLMLDELAALRTWDVSVWRETIGLQGDVLMDGAQSGEMTADFAIVGLLSRVRSGSLQKGRRDHLIRGSVNLLEFASVELRADTAYGLLATYPRQKYAAFEVLGEIADLIPEACWPALASWTATFAAEMRDWRCVGTTANPIEHFDSLLPSVPVGSPVWDTLAGEALKLAAAPHTWEKRGQLFSWLACAPEGHADAIAGAMIGSRPVQGLAALVRARMFIDAERVRGTPGRWTKALVPIESDLCERWLIAEHRNEDDRQALHEKLRQAARQRLLKHFDPSSKGIEPDGSEVDHVREWTAADEDLVLTAIEVVNSPDRKNYTKIVALKILTSLVGFGPVDFAEVVRPNLLSWIQNPPFDVKDSKGGGLKMTLGLVVDNASALETIGWLVFQMPRRLGIGAHREMLAWIERVLGSDGAEAMPLALHACVVLAAALPAENRSSVLSTAQALIVAMKVRAQENPSSYPQLEKALYYLSSNLSKPSNRLVDWTSKLGAEALTDVVRLLEMWLGALQRLPNPSVRAYLARLAFGVSQIYTLSEPYQSCLSALRGDARARVRFEADGGWRNKGK